MTTTTDSPPKIKVREGDKNSLLLRLERNQKELSQLRIKLSSYLCEPKTYSLFERLERLRHSMDNLNRSNKEVITILKERKKMVGDFVDRAKNQCLEFKRVQDGVDDYLAHCVNH